jgi:hypothetical protein
MKQILQAWTVRNAVLAGLATACVFVISPGVGDAAPAGDQFSVRFGGRSLGYPAYGRGRYGYGNGVPYGYSGTRANTFPLYGNGPYVYRNGYSNGFGNTGYSGWNQNYNTYTPYSSGYYNPYSTWSYSPYGFGIQQSYGY